MGQSRTDSARFGAPLAQRPAPLQMLERGVGQPPMVPPHRGGTWILAQAGVGFPTDDHAVHGVKIAGSGTWRGLEEPAAPGGGDQ